MSERLPEPQQSITVRELLRAPDLGLDLELLQGEEGLENEICSPRIQKLGLTLAGFSGYVHGNRVQLFGGSEFNYLKTLDMQSQHSALLHLRGLGICCIVITRRLDPPDNLLEISRSEKIALLRSSALSSVVIAKITDYLDMRLAPRMVIHGVMLDMFGLGILLIGPSGIGKSECALELVLKGHRLVADDAVLLTRQGIGRLVGKCGEVLQHHMEVRGLGIIDVRELLGISATARSQFLDLVVRLEKWKADADYDRLGLGESVIELLGASIPLIEVPVAPGRNVSAIVEVAARLHLLRQEGGKPSVEIMASASPAREGPAESPASRRDELKS
jgi:HPr kinase/phosphorylase